MERQARVHHLTFIRL